MTQILIIDDSKMVLYALQRLLEEQDMSVKTVESCEAGLEYLEEQTPDLIILDLMLPGMSGNQFFKQIKEDEKTGAIPVIVLTADTDAQKWEKELEKADRFMTKPFANEELVTAIKELL